jgi:hypothetical protein
MSNNILYRAIDSFNFPECLPLMKRIQAIRVMFEHDRSRHIHKYIPSVPALQERLTNLLVEAVNTNMQNINEIYDIAIQVGCDIPLVGDQAAAYAQYMNTGQNRQRGYSKGKYIPPPPNLTLATITKDTQNVHNSAINNNVKQIAVHFKEDYPNLRDLMFSVKRKLSGRAHWDSEKNIHTLEFIETATATFGIDTSLCEVLFCIFIWINTTSHKDELYGRLNQELSDMHGLCSTGHLSRLINVPQGYTENPRYILGIDINTEIKNYIFKTLTTILQDADEDVQEAMVDKSKIFVDFVNKTYEKNKTNWLKNFGEEHAEFIQECVDKYLAI